MAVSIGDGPSPLFTLVQACLLWLASAIFRAAVRVTRACSASLGTRQHMAVYDPSGPPCSIDWPIRRDWRFARAASVQGRSALPAMHLIFGPTGTVGRLLAALASWGSEASTALDGQGPFLGCAQHKLVTGQGHRAQKIEVSSCWWMASASAARISSLHRRFLPFIIYRRPSLSFAERHSQHKQPPPQQKKK
uniref:Uncharacterized protein n=1 Tax=Bionectria ochroleuca TaxID=29856 RepID=A0A8H7TSN6_BIOOC